MLFDILIILSSSIGPTLYLISFLIFFFVISFFLIFFSSHVFHFSYLTLLLQKSGGLKPPSGLSPVFRRPWRWRSQKLHKFVALVQGVRPFAVKISVLVCVVSHSILLSTKTARYSVHDNLALPLIYWSSLWFTVGQHRKAELTTDHIAYRKHWQEISELFMPEGLCIKPWADLNLKLFASIDPHHDAVILKLYWGFKSLM